MIKGNKQNEVQKAFAHSNVFSGLIATRKKYFRLTLFLGSFSTYYKEDS